MQNTQAAHGNALMPLLERLAKDIGALEGLAGRADSPVVTEYIAVVAEFFRAYMNEFTLIPEVMEGVEPWKSDR